MGKFPSMAGLRGMSLTGRRILRPVNSGLTGEGSRASSRVIGPSPAGPQMVR